MSDYNVTEKSMIEKYGPEKGHDAFREVADLGGFGTVGTGPGQINPAYQGGLDTAGVLAESNTAVSEKSKDRIAELTGVKRRSSEDVATTSSADKKQKTDK